MSSMDTDESNSKSMKTIDKAIESTLKITNKTGITDKHPGQKRMNKIIKKLNKPVRKLAHAIEYLLLTILLIFIFKNSGVVGKKKYLFALLICILYASIDEYHQTFVSGRTGQVLDILIDTIGGIIGCILDIFRSEILKNKKT